MLDKLLAVLVRVWRLERPIGENWADMVVAISYCTGRTCLMWGTATNLSNAIKFCKDHPLSYLCMSKGCSYPFSGAEDNEWAYKKLIIESAGLIRKTVVGESMVNTVDEAYKILGELEEQNLKDSVRRILICTGPAHSRSAYLIYRKLFPGSLVYLKLLSFEDETQPDHSVKSQRSPWVWFISNIARHMALRLMPLAWVRKIQRRPASPT